MRGKNPQRKQRGAAAVEFALVLAPLMLVVLGAIDWGYYFYIREVATNAVREGARAGSLNPADPEGKAVSVANEYLNRLKLTASTAVGCTADVACPTTCVCVKVDYVVAPNGTGSITGFLSSIMPQHASAQATMRVEP